MAVATVLPWGAKTTSILGADIPQARIAAGTETMGKMFRDAAPLLYKLHDALGMVKNISPWSDAEAAKAEPAKPESVKAEAIKAEESRGVGKVLIMAPGDRAWHDHSAGAKVKSETRAAAAQAGPKRSLLATAAMLA